MLFVEIVMQGRAFLDVARDDLKGASEAHFRSAATRAYYALFLEARDALDRWGIALPPKHSIHAFVRLRFVYPQDQDLNYIGSAVEKLGYLRNLADYAITHPGQFTRDIEARRAILSAEKAIMVLDQIEADSQRLDATIKSIRAAFP
jgi:hypothetical protein